ENTGQHGGQGHAAADGAHHAADQIDHDFGDAAAHHEVAGQHEHRDGHQWVAVDRLKCGLGNDGGGDAVHHQYETDGDEPHGHRCGGTDGHEDKHGHESEYEQHGGPYSSSLGRWLAEANGLCPRMTCTRQRR